MKVKKILLMFMGFMMGLSLSLSPAVIHADSDDPKPTSIRKLNYKKRTVRVGQKFELKAYARPYDYDDDQLIWSTGNKKIVKIISKDRRDDDITLKAMKKKTCTITVKKKAKKKYIKPTKIKLEDKRMDVDVNDTEDIDYKVYPKKATNKKVTFRSGNKRIATVNSRGDVRGVRPGRTKITLTCKANPKVKAYVYVIVEYDD